MHIPSVFTKHGLFVSFPLVGLLEFPNVRSCQEVLVDMVYGFGAFWWYHQKHEFQVVITMLHLSYSY